MKTEIVHECSHLCISLHITLLTIAVEACVCFVCVCTQTITNIELAVSSSLEIHTNLIYCLILFSPLSSGLSCCTVDMHLIGLEFDTWSPHLQHISHQCISMNWFGVT
jgi:hypothetical protein